MDILEEKEEDTQVSHIAVYGSGTIGACEATLFSGNGIRTIVIGRSESGLQRCRKTIEQNWDDLIAENLASEQNKKAAMELVTITNDPSALAGSSFVFEAVAEHVETKKEVYQRITEICGSETIVASTTSSIDADTLAAVIDNPSRFIIAHPFQPAHMLPLVEVVKSRITSERTVNHTCKLLEKLNRKIVVLNHSVPGFLINRFAQALFRECIHLIEEGVIDAENIDTAIKYAVGMRYASIGLLEYYDAVGFELEKSIAENVYPSLCNTIEIQKLILDGLASGNTGQKSGRGLFDWSDKDYDDFRRRKQAPYFYTVKEWKMPE